MTLALGLVAITIGLVLFGVMYAVQISTNPWERTYLEVAVGVGVTISGELLAIALVLFHFELFYKLWWITLFPFVAFACTGLPMMVRQEIKLRQQKWDGEKVENKFNGGDKK